MTLEDFHKKYPARPGDTVEKFQRYEEFLAKDPPPIPPSVYERDFFDEYSAWYARLAKWMENK